VIDGIVNGIESPQEDRIARSILRINQYPKGGSPSEDIVLYPQAMASRKITLWLVMTVVIVIDKTVSVLKT
jgi:hypothetical protein